MARLFNGTTDKISIAAAAGVNPASSYTISCWFYPVVVQGAGTYGTVYGQANASGNSNYFIGLSGVTGGKLGWYTENSTAIVDPGLATLTAGNWYNLVLTFNPSSSPGFFTFVNGVSDGTGNTGVVSAWGTNVTSFGYTDKAGVASLFNNQRLEDWAIWNVVLTAREIAALAAGARPGKIRPLALGAWLPFDGLQSPEPDLSGNKNNGTLTGTALAFGAPVMMFTPRSPFLLPAAPAVQAVLMAQACL